MLRHVMRTAGFTASLAIALLVIGPVMGNIAQADEPHAPQMNTVRLSADAEREVPNERFSVSLFVERRSPKASSLVAEINGIMAEALDKAKAVDGVKVSTGAYSTTPIYNYKSANKDPVWQARQDLHLESEDLEKVLALSGELQGSLQIAGVQYAVSRETRERIRDELIGEAMEAFHRRASVIGNHMPSKTYSIVDLNVDVGGHFGGNRMYKGAVAMAAAPRESAPVMEQGTSKIRVNVNGTVRY